MGSGKFGGLRGLEGFLGMSQLNRLLSFISSAIWRAPRCFATRCSPQTLRVFRGKG